MKLTHTVILLLTLAAWDRAHADEMVNHAQLMALETQSKQQIQAVVEHFRLAIINKDKETFKSLFYSDSIPWIAVFSEEMLAAKRKIKPDYPASVNLGQFGPPETMIANGESQEEKMWNIKIDTDGYLASVHFNYSDHRNGIKRAFGTEAWDLVKDGAQWKIVSVKYTVTEVESHSPDATSAANAG
jgi:hypothetical protein